jgi:hypothetical protein
MKILKTYMTFISGQVVDSLVDVFIETENILQVLKSL